MIGKKKKILNAIINYYLDSDDCNGIELRTLAKRLKIDYEKTILIVSNLIDKDLIFLQCGVNPFIVTDPNISKTKQLLTLKGATKSKEIKLNNDDSFISLVTESSGIIICLYPREIVIESYFQEKEISPYTKLIKLGKSQLQQYFFTTAVLQKYKIDPRYNFYFEDFSGVINSKQESDLSDEEIIQDFRFGLAVNKRGQREIAVSLRDLCKLSFSEQIYWLSKTSKEKSEIVPEYANAIFNGGFYSSISIYRALIEEINYIYDLSLNIYGINLFNRKFKINEEMKDCQFLFIPTDDTYDSFLLLLEKMIPGNINQKFFEGKVELTNKKEMNNGNFQIEYKGTIVLLKEWLENEFCASDITLAIKKLRKERQGPAHEIKSNSYDYSLFNKQKHLMIALYDSLKKIIKLLRDLISNYPESILDSVEVRVY